MGMHEDLRQASLRQKEIVKQSGEKLNEVARNRLEQIIIKKIQTAFIGAISACESELGYLWGFEQDQSLTVDQDKIRRIWNRVRRDILNNGNNQIRALGKELERYDVKLNPYNIRMDVRNG